jgi:hypothetical protein
VRAALDPCVRPLTDSFNLRSSKLATMKVEGPYLLLLSTSGIVDSVTSQRSLPAFLASYIFASPSASKFIAEQVPSHATYINQIPPQLLGM